jgi:hypothetical protein
MNERSYTFICPICNNRIKWENIILDEYFEEILKMAENSDDIDTIEIQPDGSWSLPGTDTTKDRDTIKKEISDLHDEDIMILDSDDEDFTLMPISSLLANNSMSPVAALPPVLATSVEHANREAYNPLAVDTSLISATEIQNREETVAPDEDIIDLTFSSDEEDIPIGITLERHVTENIYNQSASNQINPIEQQDNNASLNDPHNQNAADDHYKHVSGAQEYRKDTDAPSAEAIEKALDEALIQLDAPVIPQTPGLVSNAHPIETGFPQSLGPDMTSAKPIAKLSQPIESEPIQTMHFVNSAEMEEDLDASNSAEPAPRLMYTSSQRDRVVDNVPFESASAAIYPLPQLILRSPQSIVRDNVNFEDNELDELLSSIPDPIFPRNSANSHEKISKKGNTRRNAPVIYSSSIDVSIPGSPNDESDEELDMILSSIPDEFFGNSDKTARKEQYNQVITSPNQSISDHQIRNETNEACTSNVDSLQLNKKTASAGENGNYSLKVFVSNHGDTEEQNVDQPGSGSLKTDECVLTPSSRDSDLEEDNYGSSTGMLTIILKIAKENRSSANIFVDESQLVKNKSRSNSDVQIDKTWTAQDEDALRMVAESIFAEMDAQNRQSKRKRDFPDI